MGHPTAREIVGFRVGGMDAVTASATGGHIAGCGRCHALYQGVLTLERRLAKAFPDGLAGVFCPEEWEIAAAVSGEARRGEANRIFSHLEGCSCCTDRAAACHRALAADRAGPVPPAPEAWRRAAVHVLEAGLGEAGEMRPGTLERIRELLRRFAAGLPPIPGYAAAVALVVVVAWMYLGDREKAIVITSTEKIAFRDAQSTGSLGFMDQEAPRAPAKRMVLRGAGNRVVFRWEPPAGYSAYSFALVDKQGAELLWRRSDVSGGEVAVPGGLLSGDRVYSWQIEVILADGRTIEYTGDFLYRR